MDDLLKADHDRMHLLLARVRRGLESNSASALTGARQLREELRRHIAFEEDALFPALRGMARPPSERAIESLMIDHEVVLEKVDLLCLNLEKRDRAAARAAADHLEIFLQGHHRDEESGVYRNADRLISERDRASLLAKLRTPAERATP